MTAPAELQSNVPLARGAMKRSRDQFAADYDVISPASLSRESPRMAHSLPPLSGPRADKDLHIERRVRPPKSQQPPKAASPALAATPGKSCKRKFASDASIVLIGFRGCGKSTLGLMAAHTLGRPLVVADEYWRNTTGYSRVEYRKLHTSSECRLCEFQVMKKMLEENTSGSVIVCSPGCLDGSGQLLLQEYAKTNPVIFVNRDSDSIIEYLGGDGGRGIARLVEAARPRFLAHSNLEFFNISEPSTTDEDTRPATRETSPSLCASRSSFLTLKRTELDFARFLRRIFEYDPTVPSRAGIHYLAEILPDTRPYTYALAVSEPDLACGKIKTDEILASVDAFELSIPFDPSTLKTMDSASVRSLQLRISRSFALLRRKSVVPIIYHLDLGHESAIPQHYLDFLHFGLRFSPEYLVVDLRCSEMDFASLRRCKGSTKLLGHFFDPNPGSDGWNSDDRWARYQEASRKGCDLVRLVQPTTSMDDNFTVRQFHLRINSLPTPHPTLIAYNTGYLGRNSVAFNPILSPVTQSAASLDELTAKEAQQALYASFCLHPMRYHVFGQDITDTLTRGMFDAASKFWGLPHEWRVRHAESLSTLDVIVNDPHFGGAQVCYPFKSDVIPLLHSISPAAAAIGAVNMIVPIRFVPDQNILYDKDPRYQLNQAGPVKALHGKNTDWVGICSCISRNTSPANAIKPTTTGLVIGAGSLARASVFAMIRLGIRSIFLFSKTPSKARELADHFNAQSSLFDKFLDQTNHGQVEPSSEVRSRASIKILTSIEEPWPANMQLPNVIVSTLCSGSGISNMTPNLTLPEHWIKSPTRGVFVQLAYGHNDWPLMQQMRSSGWIIVDGYDVLPDQCFPLYEILTGRIAPRRLMRMEVLRSHLQDESCEEREYIKARLEQLERD